MKKQFYRVKQLADQTFSRSGKPEGLTNELQTADRKVEHLRNAIQLVSKRLSTGAGSTQGQDPAAREKRLKKLPEYILGLSMSEASNFDDDDSILKYILTECGTVRVKLNGNSEVSYLLRSTPPLSLAVKFDSNCKLEKFLANEIAEHELKVEQLVCEPLTRISDQDLPAIMKAKKQLNRLMNEKESASSRYSYLERQKEENPTKLSAAKEELEEVCIRVEAASDALAADMFALVAKEAELAHTLLQYVKLQRAYHESALHSLQDVVPELERTINDSSVKPVFGAPLEEHLRVTGRTIAFPIELCVCTLHELALNEEGLFRIAGSTSKVRRMKLSLDAGLFNVPLPRDYRDMHVVASVLKSYLRELREPLLTYRLYEHFINASRQPTEQARLNAIWEAIHLLPEANYQNLRYLIKFLSTLTQNQSKNKMTPSNLAIVIAPNLLWAVGGGTFDMNATTAVNCIVELLIKHADWFFQEDINFFISFTKEDLLPEQCEYGFTPNFFQGCNQTAALSQEPTNGDCSSMSRSMLEYAQSSRGRAAHSPGHSRSNSHDTSLILIEHEMKQAQSNSSLSDQSSPPHGSPKPITRRKNKPLAPVPPTFTPDKGRPAAPSDPPAAAKLEPDKPAKPPRPVVSDGGKVISGVQTINRSTYRQNKALKEEARAERLADVRRQSLELDKEPPARGPDPLRADGDSRSLVVHSLTAHTAHVGRIRSVADGPASLGAPRGRPVAAPRTLPPAAEPDAEVTLRHKPAVPERPATLRPQSFRARGPGDAQEPSPTVLERAHVYSVDKHQPAVIRVSAGAGASEEARGGVTRTHSSGAGEERALGSTRQLSQSDGDIADAPAPRHTPARPPRPLVPAPPPPAALDPQPAVDLAPPSTSMSDSAANPAETPVSTTAETTTSNSDVTSTTVSAVPSNASAIPTSSEPSTVTSGPALPSEAPVTLATHESTDL